MEQQFKNEVTKSKFIKWYFADQDTIKGFGYLCKESLIREGFFNISARMLFEECAYIPGHICENVTADEYDISEVLFIED